MHAFYHCGLFCFVFIFKWALFGWGWGEESRFWFTANGQRYLPHTPSPSTHAASPAVCVPNQNVHWQQWARGAYMDGHNVVTH